MSVEFFCLKVGDAAPALTVLVPYSDGSSPSLVGATATFAMRQLDGTPLVSGPATVDATANTLTYQWQSGDTDAEGVYLGEFTVTDAMGKVLDFPSLGYTVVTVSPSHGDRPVPELPLIFDGSWVLDGTYALNGRKVPI